LKDIAANGIREHGGVAGGSVGYWNSVERQDSRDSLPPEVVFVSNNYYHDSLKYLEQLLHSSPHMITEEELRTALAFIYTESVSS
jgi:hypothetical protein